MNLFYYNPSDVNIFISMMQDMESKNATQR